LKLRGKIMATSDRKRLIMEHLSVTGNINFKGYSQGSKAETPPIRVTTPPITPDNRKKRIKEHLARSTANFNCFSLSSPERQQQIKEHVMLSRG
jgi:hypothetical protein